MEDIKDYLHLYYGGLVEWIYYGRAEPSRGVIDDYIIMNCEAYQYVKPILRPLSSMTDKERNTALKIGVSYSDSWCGGAERTKYLLSKHFDLFGLIATGLAIDATTIK
jgi:hypothetical protein